MAGGYNAQNEEKKKTEGRIHVEEESNSLMLGAVWSTFRVTLKANIPRFSDSSVCLFG